MESWEFLIQKEGDRSWLPLESPDVEVLEGRYRVVARSSRVNTAVEVCITHIATAEDPPKRRVQKRASKTNPDGLIVVIPFTRLQPGIWELRCTGDLMSDLMGESWQYGVKLQVLSHATESAGDWEPDWQHGIHQQAALQIRNKLAQPQPATRSPEVSSSTVVVREWSQGSPVDNNTAIAPTRPAKPSEVVSPTSESQYSESQYADDAVQHETDTNADADANTETPVAEPAPEQPSLSDLEQAERLAAQVAEQAADLEAAPATAERNAAIASSPIFQMAEQMSSQIVDSIFQDFDQWEQDFCEQTPRKQDPTPAAQASPHAAAVPASATANTSTSQATPSDAASTGIATATPVADNFTPASASLQVQITLRQETYTARRGRSITISGQVKPLQTDDLQADDTNPSSSVSLPDIELHVRLRDPQTAQIVAQVSHAISAQALPLSFEQDITIPPNNQTQLLLGELLVTTTEADTPRSLLGTQSFQVTADLSELLEAIAHASSESDAVQPPLDFISTPTAANLDLTFLELVQSPRPVSQLQPSGNAILPPQLHNLKPSGTRKPLHLPTPAHSTPVLTEPSPAPNPVSSAELPSMQPNSSTVEPHPSLTDVLLDDTVAPQNWDTPAADAAQLSNADPTPQSPLSPEDTAFQSLNLQNRFWSRLNALASDTELSNWLRADPVEPLPPGDAPVGLDTDLAAQEVVVDDDPPPPLLSWTIGKYQPSPISKLPELPKPSVLPVDEPVPAPQIAIPGGELTAGESIFVTVRLPHIKPRIYVKLWLHDRQTRSLLDGPHWLVAFVPDEEGYLETRTQLTVPYGCLEVHFEAIAVEMATQRESHKVTLQRKIVPPDLPNVSLDDLMFEGLQDPR